MANDLPDKDYLYGKFQEWADWKSKLHKRLAHKSLDIAEDDDIHVNNSRNGLGWKEIATIGALALGGLHLYNNSSNNNNKTPTQTTAPIDSEYEVRFFTEDGKPIAVQPLPKG